SAFDRAGQGGKDRALGTRPFPRAGIGKVLQRGLHRRGLVGPLPKAGKVSLYDLVDVVAGPQAAVHADQFGDRLRREAEIERPLDEGEPFEMLAMIGRVAAATATATRPGKQAHLLVEPNRRDIDAGPTRKLGDRDGGKGWHGAGFAFDTQSGHIPG